MSRKESTEECTGTTVAVSVRVISQRIGKVPSRKRRVLVPLTCDAGAGEAERDGDDANKSAEG